MTTARQVGAGAVLGARAEVMEAARLQHEFGVTFEPEWKGWFDIFCFELLQVFCWSMLYLPSLCVLALPLQVLNPGHLRCF